jgi:excinuclease ABC subunit A
VFDAERVVAFPSLSLASGAVKGWDRRNGYTFSLLESVARHYSFDIDTPFEDLPEAAQVLLHGSGERRDRFVYEAEGAQGQDAQRQALASVRRHHAEPRRAASARPTRPRCAKTWRATRAPSPAPTARARGCAARRATCSCRRRARRAGRADLPRRALHAARMPGVFRAPQAAGRKAEIADKVVREIRSRLKFLNDVGLNYLSLDRNADSLSGGEAQRIRLASQIGSA